MDAFTLDISFDPNSGIAGSATVRTNTPDTTLGSTGRYAIDANGIARSPQEQGLATSLGLGAVAPFEGGAAVGAFASALANGTTAVGYHATAKVASSVAVGDQAQALAYRSIAIGRCANASGGNSISIGTTATAKSPDSIVIGDSASSGALGSSVVIGFESNGSGGSSVVVGDRAVASGAQSVAVGQAATASGSQSVAVGVLSSAVGNSSVAIGTGASVPAVGVGVGAGVSVTGNYSVALGYLAKALDANEFIGGSENHGLTNVWFGQGNTVGTIGGTVGPWVLHGDEDIRADMNGGDIKIAGGRSRGAGIGGSVVIQVSDTGASGTTLRTLKDRLVVAPRKSLVNNTTTEIFRIAIPNPSAVAFMVQVGLSISDGTNAQSYTETTAVSAIHDGSGYAWTVTSVGATTQLGGGGSALAVTVSMTQPTTDVLAFNVKSNTTVITPTQILCYIAVTVNGETVVTLV